MVKLTRRDAIELLGKVAIGVTVGGTRSNAAAGGDRLVLRKNLSQSVCRWCYGDIPLRTFCREVARVGLTAVDLLHPHEWAIAREHGLSCSTGYGRGGTLTDGLNDPANHAAIVRNLERTLPEAARAGVANVITFVGNRRGMTDAEGIDHCVSGLRRLAPVAENENVTIVLEMANSRVDHLDYQGDHTAFGVEVVERVASPRVKLVYDVYDMQIMEGDIIRTIQANQASIGLYHTGGVPGRREIDRRQEINWRAVATAIVETGFTGYLAHEFVPTRDPIASLRYAVRLCDV